MLHAFDPRFELPYRKHFTIVTIPSQYTAVRNQMQRREMQQAHWLVVIADWNLNLSDSQLIHIFYRWCQDLMIFHSYHESIYRWFWVPSLPCLFAVLAWNLCAMFRDLLFQYMSIEGNKDNSYLWQCVCLLLRKKNWIAFHHFISLCSD